MRSRGAMGDDWHLTSFLIHYPRSIWRAHDPHCPRIPRSRQASSCPSPWQEGVVSTRQRVHRSFRKVSYLHREQCSTSRERSNSSRGWLLSRPHYASHPERCPDTRRWSSQRHSHPSSRKYDHNGPCSVQQHVTTLYIQDTPGPVFINYLAHPAPQITHVLKLYTVTGSSNLRPTVAHWPHLLHAAATWSVTTSHTTSTYRHPSAYTQRMQWTPQLKSYSP